MWGYGIFCEYPGCQAFEAVSVEGEIPFGWLSVALGVDDPELNPESLGTFCGWAHALATLQKMAPDADVDLRATRARGEPVAEGVGHDLTSGRSLAELPAWESTE